MPHLTNAELDWTIQRLGEKIPHTAARSGLFAGNPSDEWYLNTSVLAALEELKDRRRKDNQ